MTEMYSLYPDGIHDPSEAMSLWDTACRRPFRDPSIFHRLSLPMEETVGTSWRHFSSGIEEEIVAIETYHGRLYPVFRPGKLPWHAIGTYHQTSLLYIDAYVPVVGETSVQTLAWATTTLRFFEHQVGDGGPNAYTDYVVREILPLVRQYRTEMAKLLCLPLDDEDPSQRQPR